MKSSKQTIIAHRFILMSYDQYSISIISTPPNRIFTIHHGIFPNRQNASPNSLGILKEIFHDDSLAVLVWLLLSLASMQVILWRSIEHVERTLPGIADLQYTCHVTTAIAVIGRAPYCAELVIIEFLVSLLAKLMSAQNMGHRIEFQEFPNDLCSKGISRTSGRKRELITFWVWIGPDQICHRTLVWYLAETVNDLDLIDGVYRRRETTVNTEYLVVYDDAQGKEIKHVRKVMPHIRIAVFPRAFRVEAIRLRNTPRFMVSAD